MAIFEWRKFNFFDLKKDPDNGKVAEAIGDAEITSATNGNNQVILCDSKGFIHVFSKSWDVISFSGHEGFAIILCEIVLQHNLLVTIGVEDTDSTPSYKVWNLSKITPAGAPCLRTVKTALQKPTALGVSDNGQYLAIGFDRGSISLYRGDIGRDRSKTLKSLSAGTTTITGIAFNSSGKIFQMFVCCDSGILVYQIQSRDRENKIILDTMCAPTRCCAIQRAQASVIESSFMVGRDDAVYCYTSDGKGPCYALEGEKYLIQWFRSHLISVSRPSKNTMYSQKDSILTVIDVQNKFIVFSTPIHQVASIIIEFGTCYIVTKSKEIYHLDEKDLQSKLSLLFKKNLYDIAVRIAKNNQYDEEGLADIFRQYGDHLYNKGDFTGAVEQYSKTIGYLEPSYVIRRFLDSRHILCLTEYLQAVHKKRHATADHTTLLLNCFTRLDQTDQLKQFLKNDENPDIIFDLDVAISVCRNASVDDALALAKRNNKHDFVLSILIEDMKNYNEALEYLSNLSYYSSEQLMKKYGFILMENSPNTTTEILKKMFTIDKITVNSNNNSDPFSDTHHNIFDDMTDLKTSGNPEDFFHLFINYPIELINFLEYMIENHLNKLNKIVYNTLIELYLKNLITNEKYYEDKTLKILKNYEEHYDKNHVLILCRNYEFWPGIMLLYEEQKLYHLILRFHLKNRDYTNLLATCKRLGSNQPSLWLQALTGLRNDKNAPSNLLSQILNVISSEKLQSPLQVLNCLAVENGPNLSSVRDYFMQVFQKEKESTKHEEELVEKYRKESYTLKEHIRNLRENTIEFRGTVCNTCQQQLNQPSLYFLCQHSFHQDCVRGYSESDRDCPMCHTKNTQLLDVLRAQSESRGQHEVFHNLLDRSAEPFSVVAEYFGRDLFNKIVIFKEDEQTYEQNQIVAPSEMGMRKPTEPAIEFGPGAEAKTRVNEIKSKIIPNQIPEGRMRQQERNFKPANYASSLEANMSHDISPSVARSQKRNAILLKTPSTNPFEVEETHRTSKNPFEDDDDNDEVDSVNPFGDDSSDPPKTNRKLNDYDKNLNPFG